MRAAAFQMLLTPSLEENRRKLLAAMGEVAGEADVLVTPECALTDYLPAAGLNQRDVAAAADQLRRECKRLKLALALGTAWREGRRLYNRVLLFNARGALAGSYDKCCLTGAGAGTDDAALFTPGRHLDVFRLGRVPVGLQICLDMRFSENWRILAQQGARVVFHSSSAAGGGAWKRPVLAGAMAIRAADNGLFIVSANNALEPQMMVSTINDPDGKVLAAAEPDKECIIRAELDLKRKEWFYNGLPPARRPDLWNRPAYRKMLLHPQR